MTDAPFPKRADVRSVSFYICGSDLLRTRAAYEATNWLEGDQSWSHFVRRALLAEAARREAKFNASQPFDGGDGPLKPGRPTVGNVRRAAAVAAATSDDDPSGRSSGWPAPDDQDDEQGRNVQGDGGQS